MAGENLGSVYYTVDADVSAMLKAEAQIDKSLTKVVSDFSEADRAVKEFTEAQRKMGREVNAAGQVMDRNGKIIADASNEYRRLATQAEKYRAAAIKQTPVARAVRQGFQGMGQAAQNFSYQIQDISVQLAGGQNPILVFAQQLPQMLVGMGPVAAGVAALLAVLGALYLALSDSADATKAFSDALDAAGDVMTTANDGTVTLSDSIRELAEVSVDAAKAQLASAWLRNRDAIQSADKAAIEAFENIQKYLAFDDINLAVGGFEVLTSRVEMFGGTALEQFRTLQSQNQILVRGLGGLEDSLDSLGDTLGITEDDAFGLVESLAEFTKTKSAESIAKLATQLNNLSRQSGAGNKNLSEFAIAISDLSTQVAQAQGDQDKLNRLMATFDKEIKKVSGSAKDAADNYNELVKSYGEAFVLLGKNEREQAKLNAQLRLGSDVGAEQVNAVMALIDSYYDRVEAAKAVAESVEAQIRLEEREIDTMLRLKREAESLAKSEEQRAKNRSKTVTTRVETIASGVDPVTELQAQREKQLALVREYEQLETAEHQVAVDARKAIDDEYNAKLAAAQEARFVAQSESNRMLIEGINSLGDTASNVLTGMLTQTLDLRSAMLGFANAVLNSAVNAIIQMGIEHVKAAVIGQAADQAAATAKATTQAAAAAQHTAAVTATVAELTSLAAAGAFAATAAIPIVGPAAAPAAAAEAGTATSGIGAAAIAAAPIAGMRLYGGPTSPNSLYKVNEDGRPEMFSDGRDSFLMTGSRGGEVTSNGDLGKSETPINIVVNNNAPNSKAMASYDQESRTVTIAVNEVGRQFRENKGAAFDGLVAGTTANGRAI